MAVWSWLADCCCFFFHRQRSVESCSFSSAGSYARIRPIWWRTLLVRNAGSVIQIRVPASVFLIAHGVVKLALVGGLATNKLGSYPAAIVVFTIFTIYQAYQLSHQYSLFLEIVTVLDIIIVLLVVAEYRHVRLVTRRHL